MEAVAKVDKAVDLIRDDAAEIERATGHQIKAAKAPPQERYGSRLRTNGAFAVTAPFNFPVALSPGRMAAALVAGSTVVFQPHEMRSWTGQSLIEDALGGAISWAHPCGRSARRPSHKPWGIVPAPSVAADLRRCGCRRCRCRARPPTG